MNYLRVVRWDNEFHFMPIDEIKDEMKFASEADLESLGYQRCEAWALEPNRNYVAFYYCPESVQRFWRYLAVINYVRKRYMPVFLRGRHDMLEFMVFLAPAYQALVTTGNITKEYVTII